MFERFTDPSRRVVVLAQEEARQLGHNYIGTEHILLGLIRESESVADPVVDEALEGRLSLDKARRAIVQIIGESSEAPAGHIPFTPRAKKVLELSLREAMRRNDRGIQPAHILLGLFREGEGVGAQVLAGAGIDFAGARSTIEEALGPAARPEPSPGRGFLRSLLRQPTPQAWVAEVEFGPETAFVALPEGCTDAAAAAVDRARGETALPTAWSLLTAIAAGDDVAASLLAGLDLSAAPAEESAQSFLALFDRAGELASALGPDGALIDTLHLLAVLLSPGEGSVSDDLAAAGADPVDLRRRVLALL